MSDLRRLLFANQTRAYEGYPLVISRSVALRYLKQYQIYGNSEQGLPAGYTPLEYITCDNSWIDLPTYGTQNTEIECKALITSLTASKQLFGSYAVTQGANITCNFVTSATWQFGSRISSNLPVANYITLNVPFVVKINSQMASIDGTTILTGTTTDFTTTNKLRVGGASGSSAPFVGNIYYYIQKDNGVLTYHLIPAKRNSDDAIGMYDTVSGQFFTNAGTGTFTAGPALPTPENPIEVISVGDRIIPDGYTKLEYIESTGTQYIDTGFKFTTTSKIELETLITNNTGFMGSNNTSLNRVRLGVSSGKLYNQLALDTNLFIEQDNQYHKYITTATEVYIDNIQRTIEGFENQTTNYCIFGQNDARTSAISAYLAAKLKYLKIWDNDTLVHNFIPAKRNSDSAIGMYDTVSGQFFTNAGTGTFTAGPAVTNYVVPVVSGVVCVDLGTLDWSRYASGQGYTYRTDSITDRKGGNESGYLKGYEHYTGAITSMADKTFAGGATTSAFFIRDDDYVDEASFKDAMSGKMLYYQRTTDSSWSEPITTPIYLNAPLRKVGDYADVLDYKKGQIIRNVGVKVLDGTEDWTKNAPTQNAYFTQISGAFAPDTVYIAPLCSHYPEKPYPVTDMGDFGIKMSKASSQTIVLIKDETKTSSSDFTTYLAQQYAAGTPVIVYYPLETSVTENIVASALPTMAGSTTYTTETVVKPSNMKGVF